MRKNPGFTLIELMVVMAIIAILATAGLSAYGGYLKKARDTTRLEDMRALESVAIASFSASGQSVSHTDFEAAVNAMNNGVLLVDPLDGTEVCLYANGDSELECGYQYYQCQDGGYVLRVSFESSSNTYLYAEDKLNTGSTANDPNSYDIWNCTTVDQWDFIR